MRYGVSPFFGINPIAAEVFHIHAFQSLVGCHQKADPGLLLFVAIQCHVAQSKTDSAIRIEIVAMRFENGRGGQVCRKGEPSSVIGAGAGWPFTANGNLGASATGSSTGSRSVPLTV
jgi:hypothetical protein